jgi:Ribonuclease G/E
VRAIVPSEVANYLLNKKRRALGQIENRHNLTIEIIGHADLLPADGRIEASS